MIILDGKKLKEEILENLKDKVKDLDLTLAVIQIGHDEASNVYIKQKKKICESLNINFNYYNYEDDVKEEEIIKLIRRLNKDKTTGILLQLPIPEHLNVNRIINEIDYRRDVDGLTDKNIANLSSNKGGLIPCTPKGIRTLLNAYNIPLEGANVVIVGRSNLVGKPLSKLMINENATVTVCHTKTVNLKDITKRADILVVATGCAHLIKDDMVKKGAAVIDVGISRINEKLVGDVDFDNVKKKASYITPVPGGVGPMTIASLAENIYEAYLLQKNNFM